MREALKMTEPLLERIRIEARLDEYAFVVQTVGTFDWMERRISNLREMLAAPERDQSVRS